MYYYTSLKFSAMVRVPWQGFRRRTATLSRAEQNYTRAAAYR